MKDSAQQFLLTALQYYDEQKWTDAEQACHQSLQQHPNHPDALHLLGLLACQQGNLEQGIPYYQKALALKPTDVKIFTNLGMALKNQGNFEEAVAIYQQGLALDPNYAKIHINLGDA